MPQFTPDEQLRWDRWQQSNAIAARRSDRIAKYIGLALTATILAGALALWL